MGSWGEEIKAKFKKNTEKVFDVYRYIWRVFNLSTCVFVYINVHYIFLI